MSTIADRIRNAALNASKNNSTSRANMVKLVLETISNDLVTTAETTGVTSINYKYIASRGIENFPRSLKDNAKSLFKQQKATEGVDVGDDKLTAIDTVLKESGDEFMFDLCIAAGNEGLRLRHEFVAEGKGGGLFLVVDVDGEPSPMYDLEERRAMFAEIVKNREVKPKTKKAEPEVETEDVFDDGNVPEHVGLVDVELV